jgi:hypothetical protein
MSTQIDIYFPRDMFSPVCNALKYLLPDDQDRAWRIGQNAIGDRSEQPFLDTASAAMTHDDQIRVGLDGMVNDLVGGTANCDMSLQFNPTCFGVSPRPPEVSLVTRSG